jgi:plasmid segregation protein ParM
MNIIAVDLGFMYTKALINGKPVIMKSVVGNKRVQRFNDLNMGMKDDTDNLQCRVGTEEYFVSDLAIEQSDTVLHSLKGDRFSSEATEVILKTSMAVGLGNDTIEAITVSGLPVSHYTRYKQDIARLFIKTHNFQVLNNGSLLRGSVKITDGKFIPQPFGALLDRILNSDGTVADKGLATKTVAVIDIGFGTTDIYTADALSPVEKLTFSTTTAMNHAYSLISNKIEEQFGVMLPLHSVEKVVSSKQFRKSGKVYNMEDLIQWAYKATAQQLLAEVTNKWKHAHEIDHILLSGGGGIALSRYIMTEFDNIELLNNTQWSVVNGYHKWGVRQFA